MRLGGRSGAANAVVDRTTPIWEKRPMNVKPLAAAVLGAALVFPGVALPHHASAPHFMTERTIEFTGVVQSWRAINPHAVMMLTVTDESGSHTWRCEADGVAFIKRFGITGSTFKAGDRLEIKAAPGRRDPRLCLLREAKLPSGEWVSFSLQNLGKQQLAAPARQNTSIYGTWEPPIRTGSSPAAPPAALPPAAGPGSTALATRAPILDKLTEEGRRALAKHDPIRDDPARRCSPVGQQRLWNAVASAFSIKREGEKIILRHEFMDAVRTVHLDRKDHSRAGSRTLLGHSIGRFEGDTLVIETANFAPGVTQQYALDAKGTLTSLLHSDAYQMVERIRFVPERKQLEVRFSHNDPKFYTEPFPDQTRYYETASEPDFGKFNCRPDVDQVTRRARLQN
jgi:hypothetical protein